MESNYLKMNSSLKEKSNYVFDYEIQSISHDNSDELNPKILFCDKATKKTRKIHYNSYWDSLDFDEQSFEDDFSFVLSKPYQASFLKRLVSKKKRRFQNNIFDLDMAYITRRVIAMGFPSQGCESIYRNSLSDVQFFFKKYHGSVVKIYNLCIEDNRIYPKNAFHNKVSLALFPSKDHNPCSVKLILEFCIDLMLYMIKFPDGVVGIHCKAGKGRTGVMIVCYLIFSGLCSDSQSALELYAEKRTLNKKGVTIESQKRYILYFENFLKSCYEQPYYKMIPKILQYQSINVSNNILQNLMSDNSYYHFVSKFRIKKVQIGPLKSKSDIQLEIQDISSNRVQMYNHNYYKFIEINGEHYYLLETDSPKIGSDINFKLSKALKFEFWINLFQETLNKIFQFTNQEEFKNLQETHFLKPTKKSKEKFKSIFFYRDRYERSSDAGIKPDIIEEVDIELPQMIEKHPTFVEKSKSMITPNDKFIIHELFEKANHNYDLNDLVNKINIVCYKSGIELFDQHNIAIRIGDLQFDKLKSKNLNEKFGFEIIFDLIS